MNKFTGSVKTLEKLTQLEKLCVRAGFGGHLLVLLHFGNAGGRKGIFVY